MYNQFVPIHEQKVHVPDSSGRKHVYDVSMRDMFFIEEEYERHQRIKAHMVVALEALNDAMYFLKYKQSAAED